MAGYAAGAAIYYGGPSGNLRLRALVIYGFMTGIQLDSQTASQVWVTDVDLANNAIYGLLVTDLGGNAFFQPLEVSCPVSTYYAQAVGVRINRGDGYQISDSLIFQCGKAALALQPTASTAPLPSPENNSALTNVFLSNTQFDFAYGPFSGASDSAPTSGSSVIVDGSLFNPSSVAPVLYVYFSNCSGTAPGLNGFFIRNCGRVDLTGCKAFANAGHGLRIDSPSSHVRIVGGQYFSNNNQNGHNSPFTHDGIFLGAGVNDFSVAHATCSFTTGDSQRYGINVSLSSSDRYSISGCDVLGYSGTAINDMGSGSHKEVFQILGYD